jgi:hypothetical protein
MLPRNDQEDEVLGLNCTWYADVLMTLTAPRPAAAAPDATAGRPPAAGPA